MAKFSKYATVPKNENWEKFIERETALYSRNDDVRSPFARDYTRILHSMAYRRLIQNGNDLSPVFQHHINNTILGKYYKDKKSKTIIIDANDIATDFIASMTDDYFIDICRHLHIDDAILKELEYHEYF